MLWLEAFERRAVLETLGRPAANRPAVRTMSARCLRVDKHFRWRFPGLSATD